MGPARLASKQQAATSPAGPFQAPRATRVPKSNKMLARHLGWFSATFSGTSFFWSDPHRPEMVIWWYFGPFWAADIEKNSGPGPKTEKHNFSVLRVPKQKNKCTTLSGMVVRNFLTLYVLTDRTPTGGKTRKYKDFGPFWPRRVVGT